jgi:hypothetical protein
VTYLFKAQTVKPAKTHCYTTTGKHAMTSLRKKPLLHASRYTADVARQPSKNDNTGKVYSEAPRGATVQELFGEVISFLGRL